MTVYANDREELLGDIMRTAQQDNSKIVGVQVFPTATDALAWILLIRGFFLFLRPGFISASE